MPVIKKCNLFLYKKKKYSKRKPQTPADSVKLESSVKSKGKSGNSATSKGAKEKESKDAKRQVK